MSTEEVRMDPAAGSQTETTSETNGSASTGAKTAENALADELREFGKEIEAMFHTARSSTRGREIEAQLTAAWRDVENGVNSAINKAQSSDIKGTVQGTAQYAADEIQGGLARGLKNLNQWMRQKRTEMAERQHARESSAPSGATMSGSADNEVADRFTNEPVFGQEMQVPMEPDPKNMTGDNPVSDRFTS